MQIDKMCPDRSPECQDLWDFFAEHIRVFVKKYQTEELLQSQSKFLTKETLIMLVLNHFVENLLGLHWTKQRFIYQSDFTH